MKPVSSPRAQGDAIAAVGPSVPTRVLAVLSIVLTIEIFLQQWGKIIHDTRVDLAIDPARFMANSLHFWDPIADMGRVQNQAAGYLIPMGPFFLIGHLLAIPTWIVQRTWIAILMCLALWGFARLADAFDIGTIPWRVIGAVAYTVSPLFLTRGAALSEAVLGAALLPWAMIPLVRGSRSGSPRRAACLSAIAILFMGGVNAVVTIAVLFVPALYLLTRQRGRRRTLLIRWWVLATSLVCLWWFGALVFQGKYGLNFLAFTERAATTTAATSPFEIIRGTGDWLSYLNLWNKPLPAGHALVATASVVLATALVAGAGLYGLARRDLPERTFLVFCFLFGVAAIGIGYGGFLGNPLAGEARNLLDGVLAVFRTVYKFEPIVLLPVIFGFIHAGTRATATVVERSSLPRGGRTVIVPLAGMVVVLVAAGPMFAGMMAAYGGFNEVPSYWGEARQFVGDQGGRTLEVPGLPVADFNWGIPQEGPFNWDTTTPWATRSIAPLGSPAATRYLDGIESAISRGGDPGLRASLAAGGFTTVTARNDGSWQKYLAPSPPQVNGALIASGLKKIGSFGRTLSFTAEENPDSLEIHQIDVYAVEGGSNLQAYNIAESAVLSGGPESPMALDAAGGAARAYVLASDLAGLSEVPPNWVVTDGNRRRYNYFGLTRNNASYVLTPTDGSPTPQPLSAGLLPTDKIENQTVASLEGVRSITASSYGSWLAGIPESAPYRAFDGNPTTAWIAGTHGTSIGEWIQVNLNAVTTAPTIQVQLLEDGPWRPQITALRVTTEAGQVTTQVRSDESVQTIAMPPGPTNWVQIGFADGGTSKDLTSAGIRDITIPGVSVVRRLVTPSELIDLHRDPSMPLPSYSFQRAQANAHSLLRSDEETSINRAFEVPHDGSAIMTARVASDPSPALLDLVHDVLRSAQPDAISARATSTLRNLPEYGPWNLLDGNDSTLWLASQANTTGKSGDPVAVQVDDPNPHVLLSWKVSRTIDTLRINAAPGYSAPLTVKLTDGTITSEGKVEDDGTVHLDHPITTDHLDISFPIVNRVTVLTGNATTDQNPFPRPIGLTGIDIPALGDLYPKPVAASEPVLIPCAVGPVARVNDRDVHLSIQTNLRSVLTQAPTVATVCDDPAVDLKTGINTLDTSVGTGAFNVTSIGLEDRLHPLPPVGPTRTVEQLTWSSTARSLQIGAGQATYLAVNENVNKGWIATLNGNQLKPTVLDGWRQAFIVPAGEGGVIQLHFAPDRAYQAALVIGLVLALVPFLLLALPVRPGRGEAPVGAGQWPRWLLWTTTIGCTVMIAGPGALLLVPLWFVGRRRRGVLSLIAVGAYGLAAVWVAATVQPFHNTWQGAFGWPATTLSVVALMAVAASQLFDPGPRGVRRPVRGSSQQVSTGSTDHVPTELPRRVPLRLPTTPDPGDPVPLG